MALRLRRNVASLPGCLVWAQGLSAAARALRCTGGAAAFDVETVYFVVPGGAVSVSVQSFGGTLGMVELPVSELLNAAATGGAGGPLPFVFLIYFMSSHFVFDQFILKGLFALCYV